MDETAMVILFTQEDIDGVVDWEYDMYCGDDMVKCLSNGTFDELVDTFQKSMEKKNLYYALDDSWNLVKKDLAKTKIHPIAMILIGFVLCFYVISYNQMFADIKRR